MRLRTPHRFVLAASTLAVLVGVAAPAIAFAADGDASSSATSKATTSTTAFVKPTVVLVHGAWADSSGWSKVIENLRHDGYPVVAIANPLQGLTSDSAYLDSYLAAIHGPVVLVGHSYGGAVISNSAPDPDVKALVYVAGFIPAKGESVGDLAAKSPSFPLITTVVPGGAEVAIDPAHFQEVFANDVDKTTAADEAATQRPANTNAVTQIATNQEFRSIPSWDLVTTEDHAISPTVQRFMADRAGAHVQEVKSGHDVMISHPRAVTKIIETAATSTR
jgi:pimeloyl-ACP methyl ester carboxylesterase